MICGSMFSGKTEELIRRLRRAQIARQSVGIFKPKVDSRFSHDHIVSHSELRMASEIVESAEEILDSSAEHGFVEDWRPRISALSWPDLTKISGVNLSAPCRNSSPKPNTSQRHWPSASSAETPPTTPSG